MDGYWLNGKYVELPGFDNDRMSGADARSADDVPAAAQSDGSYGVIDDPEDFFDGFSRMYGPCGYTHPARVLLMEFMSPVAEGGVVEFAGVPVALATVARDECLTACVDAFDGCNELLLAAARRAVWATSAGQVTMAGLLVDVERPDERFELTAVHVDGPFDAFVVAEATGDDDVTITLEPVGSGVRLVVTAVSRA